MSDIHRLAPVLVAGHRRNDLCGDGAGHLETFGGLNHLAVDGGAVVQHVLDVDQAAVKYGLDKVIRIVKMNDAVVVCQGDMLWQKHAAGHIPGYLPGNVVPLCGGKAGVLVGIFLRKLLVLVADQFQNGLIRGVGLAQQAPLVAVDHVFLGEGILVVPDQVLLYHILHMLHGLQLLPLLLHRLQDLLHQSLPRPVLLLHLMICLTDGRNDLPLLIGYYPSISLLNPHSCLFSFSHTESRP